MTCGNYFPLSRLMRVLLLAAMAIVSVAQDTKGTPPGNLPSVVAESPVEAAPAATPDEASALAPLEGSEAIQPPDSSALQPLAPATKIVVYESALDSDATRKANAFIRDIGARTEIAIEDWKPREGDGRKPLLTLVLHGKHDRERLVSLIDGIKRLGVSEVGILVRLEPDGTGANEIIVNTPRLQDRPELHSLWEYLKAQPDFEIRAPAGNVIQSTTKSERDTAPMFRNAVEPSQADTSLAGQELTAPIMKVFMLQNIRATEAARTIEQLYITPETKFDRQVIRLSVDERTNTLIVRGDGALVQEIEALLLRLDDASIPHDNRYSQPRQPPAGSSPMGSGPMGHSKLGSPLLQTPDGGDILLGGRKLDDAINDQVFHFYVGFAEQSLDELRTSYDALEQKAQELARRHRHARTNPSTDDRLKEELQQAVQQAFAARQKLQRAELAEFARRLESMNQSIEMRDRIADQIVDRRVGELLDPNLRWDDSKAPPGTQRIGR